MFEATQIFIAPKNFGFETHLHMYLYLDMFSHIYIKNEICWMNDNKYINLNISIINHTVEIFMKIIRTRYNIVLYQYYTCAIAVR